VSTEQQEVLDAILRQSAFPVGSNVNEQRRLLRELTSAQPLPADVTVTAAALGGVPTAEITIDGIEPRHVVLYFHGGVYAIGDAFLAADLASQIGRRTHAKVISVDYRLAPEHPYPAAINDALAAYQALLHNGTAPSDIAFAGESAGGGLAILKPLIRGHGRVLAPDRRMGTNQPLDALLLALNQSLRGWCAYFRPGVSHAAFKSLSHYAWARVIGWLRRKHRRITWKELRRRFCSDGWWPTGQEKTLFNPATVRTTRYRYRGAVIPAPWPTTG